MTLELRALGTLRFRMIDTLRLPLAAASSRVIVTFADVTLSGERIRARQKGALAGDWLSIAADGTASLDIRFTLETEDGALVYVHALGRTDAARFAADGGPMFLTPRFETGDPRYVWMNKIQAVAKGMAKGADVEFEMMELV